MSPLIAECTTCGAGVPIVFSSVTPACAHCGSERPLEATIEAKIASVRACVASQNARSQQLIGRQASLGRLYGLSLLMAMSTLWLLVFLSGWFMIELPDSVSVADVFLGKHPGNIDVRARFWITWAVATGVGAMLLGYGITMIRMRRLVRCALPRRPLTAGGLPRCRVCAAELAAEGRVRRCAYCHADHLIHGERFQREDSRLDQELHRMEGELVRSLEERVKAADGLLWKLGGLLPLLAVSGAPLAVFLVHSTDPKWLAIPMVTLVLGAVLLLIGKSMPVPDIRTREEARAGDTLLVAGRHVRVQATLSFGLWPFAGALHFLSAPPGADAHAALEGLFVQGDEEPCYGLRLEPGGAAMNVDEVARAKAESVTSPQSWQCYDMRPMPAAQGPQERGPLTGVEQVWFFGPQAAGPASLVGARLWFGESPEQRSDPTPSYTISKAHRLAADAVHLVQ